MPILTACFKALSPMIQVYYEGKNFLLTLLDTISVLLEKIWRLKRVLKVILIYWYCFLYIDIGDDHIFEGPKFFLIEPIGKLKLTLWKQNLKIQHCWYQGLSLDTISWASYILVLCPQSSKWEFSSRFPYKNYVYITCHSHSSYISSPS